MGSLILPQSGPVYLDANPNGVDDGTESDATSSHHCVVLLGNSQGSAQFAPSPAYRVGICADHAAWSFRHVVGQPDDAIRSSSIIGFLPC